MGGVLRGTARAGRMWGFPLGGRRTQEGHDGLSALVKLKMSPHFWEGACCCQSFTDGSRRNNRSLAGGLSLYSSTVDLGCRSCMCSFMGTWDTHAGHLGGPGRQRQRSRSLGPPRGRPVETHGAERQARASQRGVSQGGSFPSKRGQILRPFRKPLGTLVVAELAHGPRQCPKALGAEAHGVSVRQSPVGGKT